MIEVAGKKGGMFWDNIHIADRLWPVSCEIFFLIPVNFLSSWVAGLPEWTQGHIHACTSLAT